MVNNLMGAVFSDILDNSCLILLHRVISSFCVLFTFNTLAISWLIFPETLFSMQTQIY